MLTHEALRVMGWIGGWACVAWHFAICVALVRAARETKWQFSLRASVRALVVAAVVIAIVAGALAIGIRDMPPDYYKHNAKKSSATVQLLQEAIVSPS